jgi:hypothetical protein
MDFFGGSAAAVRRSHRVPVDLPLFDAIEPAADRSVHA